MTKTESKSIISSIEAMDENKIKMHIQARHIGAMEIICLLNSKSIIKLSSRVEFLMNASLELRILIIRRIHEIE